MTFAYISNRNRIYTATEKENTLSNRPIIVYGISFISKSNQCAKLDIFDTIAMHTHIMTQVNKHTHEQIQFTNTHTHLREYTTFSKYYKFLK